MVPTSGVVATPMQDKKESEQPLQKPVLLDQNSLNPIFQNEDFSLAGLTTSGIGSYLSSSMCSSFVPQKDLAKPSANQSMLQGSCLSSKHLAAAQPNHLSKTFQTGTVPLNTKSCHYRYEFYGIKSSLA